MTAADKTSIIDAYERYLDDVAFPCVAAKAAHARGQVHCFVADHMACPHSDSEILQFLYEFVDSYRDATTSFHSAAVIFKGPEAACEDEFEPLLWQRLQALSNLDAANHSYDHRVSTDPASPHFSFSVKGEAFFIIGLHPGSSREARRFAYPTLVFNPHAEFEKLRAADCYGKMKDIVRRKDMAATGSINPMLTDFGDASDVYQYSGKRYGADWQCPLKINHAGS
jgi:FPC/CPF motif-containing protein YcgG